MFSTHTQPAPLGGPEDGLSAFRVESPTEALALLRSLQETATPVHLSNEGGHIASTLWTVDGARAKLSFSVTADEPGLDALLGAPELTGVAYLDAVKLQFDAAGVVLVHGPRSAALQTDLPHALYRFQRRESFRVRTLPRTSPTATLRHPALPDMLLSLRIIDVSIGGCALFLPADVPAVPPGIELAGVRMTLDGDTRFEARLRLQHVSALHGAGEGLRLGCEFAHLDGAAARALQRYIDQAQKRRRLFG